MKMIRIHDLRTLEIKVTYVNLIWWIAKFTQIFDPMGISNSMYFKHNKYYIFVLTSMDEILDNMERTY